jgi:YfiH family protein
VIITHDRSISYFCFSNLHLHSRLTHFVSTRSGGVSTGRFESLNLSFKAEPDSTHPLDNRTRLFKALCLPIQTLTVGRQIHSSNVTFVQAEMAGAGATTLTTALPDTDALITSSKGVTIAVLIADCAPILLFDRARKAIGVVHAGRMGTVEKIARRTIQTMVSTFCSSPSDIMVGIGPSICAAHYPVSNAAQEEIRTKLGAHSLVTINGRICFDLGLANRQQLIAAGIHPQNIEMSQLCTFEHSEIFFSERRDGAPTGRFCAGICMIP